jgi:hypothetical protein
MKLFMLCLSMGVGMRIAGRRVPVLPKALEETETIG